MGPPHLVETEPDERSPRRIVIGEFERGIAVFAGSSKAVSWHYHLPAPAQGSIGIRISTVDCGCCRLSRVAQAGVNFVCNDMPIPIDS